jgi:hypothetical protein
MLLRTIFALALFAIIGETIVHGAGALAAHALHQRALQSSKTAFVTGIATAQASIAQTLAAHPSTTVFAVPSPIATCAC